MNNPAAKRHPPPIRLSVTCLMLMMGAALAPAGNTAFGAPQTGGDCGHPTQDLPTGPTAATTLGGGLILGTVKFGSIPVPGASVTATNTLTGRKYATTTDVAGAYKMSIAQNGRYVLRVELAAFAAVTKEAVLNATVHDQTANFALILASRAQQQDEREDASQPSKSIRQYAGGEQSLSLSGSPSGLIGAGTDTVNPGAQLPSMAGDSDLSSESVAVSGRATTTNPFAGLNSDQIRQGFENQEQMKGLSQTPGAQGGVEAGNGGLGFGGPGGSGPGGGPGVFMMGGGGGSGHPSFRNFKPNQPHGTLFWTAGNSALNAKDFALRGQSVEQPGYGSSRFGITFIGAPYIPRLMKAAPTKDTVFFTLFDSRSSSPFDQYGTVPTQDERSGTAYGLKGTQIVSQATALLAYLPEPNLNNSTQNYHRLAILANQNTTVGLRYIHNFGASSGTGMPALLAQILNNGPKGFHQNINVNFNYSHSANDVANLFPDLDGKQQTHQYSLALGYTFGFGKRTNNVTLNWNRTNSALRNGFTDGADVATQSGIRGPNGSAINANPLNYGLPNLVFSDFNSLNETQPNFRTNQTISLSDISSWNRGKHNVRFGGDVRRVHLDLLGGTNATGSFYFTGLFTGSSFEDFLLGKPQESTIQSPQQKAYMRANTWDLFAQDDWRVNSIFTVLAGVRYEYFPPYSEKYDRLVDLDHTADFTSVVPVYPNGTGPYSGKFAHSLLNPDRAAFSPRVGFAVRPVKDTVVRGGYGINFTNGQYANFIQNLAYQPPFANVQTNETTKGGTISLADGFPAPQSVGNYAVNKNFRLPYVQVWNLDIQRTLPLGIVLNVGYNGAKGSRLNTLDAPGRFGNTSASGVFFNFEDSLAFSKFNALAMRARKRMQNGVSMGATYTYSHSIDDAASVGAGAGVVAQNWQDLRAEESNSSFDLRQQLSGDWQYDLPFGRNMHYVNNGWLAKALGGVSLSGTFTFASGSPLTPSIAAATTDVARGTAGSLRPSLIPASSITAGGGSLGHWFNTAALCMPGTVGCPTAVFPSGQYGTASRFSIPGPGTVLVNMSLSKTFQFQETRGLEVRVTANNAFNIVQYGGVDTQLGSPAFGQVTSARNMRQITMIARYRF